MMSLNARKRLCVSPEECQNAQTAKEASTTITNATIQGSIVVGAGTFELRVVCFFVTHASVGVGGLNGCLVTPDVISGDPFCSHFEAIVAFAAVALDVGKSSAGSISKSKPASSKRARISEISSMVMSSTGRACRRSSIETPPRWCARAINSFNVASVTFISITSHRQSGNAKQFISRRTRSPP
jgi:hypothetical protein